MILIKSFKNIDQVPLIYKCLVCNRIPKKALQDSECGRLTCTCCLQIDRLGICSCKITLIDHLTHKTLEQIYIGCQLCRQKINYYQFNKHFKICEIAHILSAETQNLQFIYELSEKLICKICKLPCTIVCKYCQISCCNNCRYKQTICCQQIKFNQFIDLSEEYILRIAEDQYECNLCCEKINNFINHLEQCQMLFINCEICFQDYQRKNYFDHLEECLDKKTLSLQYKKEIHNLVIDIQNSFGQQAQQNHFKNYFSEFIDDSIAREDETD
ncbi:hypothetical protein pb186bvf_000144 [Paramecium bursaria]